MVNPISYGSLGERLRGTVEVVLTVSKVLKTLILR